VRRLFCASDCLKRVVQLSDVFSKGALFGDVRKHFFEFFLDEFEGFFACCKDVECFGVRVLLVWCCVGVVLFAKLLKCSVCFGYEEFSVEVCLG